MNRFLIALAVAMVGFTAQAQSVESDIDQKCLGHSELVIYLDRAFKETRVAVAELENGNRMELFASRRGTWTLVELMPDGKGCVNAHGKRMQVEKLNLDKRPAS